MNMEYGKGGAGLGQPPAEAGAGGDSTSLAEAQLPPPPDRMAFSLKETAGVLGVSEKTVRRLVARRLLRPSRALRHLLIARREVERFLAETATDGGITGRGKC